MTATLERPTESEEAQAQRAGVLVVERTGRGAVAGYAHGFCSHLQASGVPTYLLTPKRDQQPQIDGCPEYLVGTWLRDTAGRHLPVRAVLEVVNLIALLYAMRRLRVNVVAWHGAVPRRLDALTVRLLHFVHRRVLWVAHEALPPDRVLSFAQIGIPLLLGGIVALWHPYLGMSFLPGAISFAVRFVGFWCSVAGAWLLFRWVTVERGSVPMYVRKLYKRVDTLVVFTEADANRLVLALPEISPTVRVIPYGSLDFLVDARADPAEARRHLGLSLRSGTVLCICPALDPGLDDFVAVLARLRAQGNDVEAILLDPGTGGTDAIRAKLAAAGLGPSGAGRDVVVVECDPFTPEAAEYFEAADAVVIPQRRRATPALSMLALAHARPVVVTEAAGMPEAVASGVAGEVARGGDPESLATAVAAVLFPRRRLQQRQWELAQHADQRNWDDVLVRYLPLLQLDETRTGRRISVRASNRAQATVWIVVLWVALFASVSSMAKGLAATNFALIGAIALPLVVVFFFTTSFETKVLTAVVLILVGDLIRRFVFPLPVQIFWSLAMYAALLHMIMQPPPVKLRLKGTRPVHALVLLYAGWVLAQLFNPNVTGVGFESYRSMRTYLEPLLLYGVLLVYVQDRRAVKRLFTVVVVVGFVALLWGTKSALIGYFGFEKAYFNTIGARLTIAESRNVGTMQNASNWSLFCAALLLLALGGLLERGAFKRNAFLILMLPMAAIGAVTSGNRIALAAIAVATPVVLVMGLGSGRTRVRAFVAVCLMAVAALMVWTWIPDTSSGRRGLSQKNPIEATRQKLATIKDRSTDQASLTDRVEEGGKTIDAVLEYPIGGGMGVLTIANFGNALGGGQQNSASLMGGGNSSTDEARSRNKVSVKAGDYYFINLMAETGMPGLIIMVSILVLTLVSAVMAYLRLRTPLFRAVALAAVAWMVGNIVNSITNGAFFSVQTSGIFWMFVAAIFAMPRIEEQELGPVGAVHAGELDAISS